MKTILSIFCIFTLGCAATTPDGGNLTVAQQASNFANSDAGKALGNTLINVALSAGQQYAGTGTVDPQTLVAATLDGGAASMRTLVNTPGQTSPNAINQAVSIGANTPGISKYVPPIVAAQVSKQIQNGTSPPQAIENVATVMNKAAANTRKAKRP